MPTVIDPDGERVVVIDPRASQPFRDWIEGSRHGVGLVGGRTVSYAELYAEQPWVGAAVDWFIWKSVLVPLKVYRRTGPDGDRQRLRPGEHKLADAIAKPWEGGNSAKLTQHLLGPLLVHGNGLTTVDSGAGNALRLDIADWRRIIPIREDAQDPFSKIIGWVERGRTQRDDKPRPLSTTMHMAWWSPLGELGVAPLRKLDTTLRLEHAAQTWATGILARGFRPNGVVELDDRFLGLDPDDRQEIYNATAARFRDIYAGAGKAGEVPILPPGIKYSDANPTTAVEAQLVDQRRVNREEVAAVYQIPPPMLGILDRATYANISTLRQVAYTDGLAPPLVMIEAAINATICRDFLGEPDVYVEYDFGGVLRGDRLKEIQAIREAISTAVLTPNEGRDMTNRPRSTNPAADELYLPANNLKRLGWDDSSSNSSTGGSGRRRR